jgi:cation/acetate symporter
VHLDSPTRIRFPAATAYRVDGVQRVAQAGASVTLPAGTLRLAAGTPLPTASGITAQTGTRWARPVGGGADSSPLFVYSLLLATFLGTMGLPHILVRFYTNPDGPAARRTTVNVLVLIGIFYLFPGIYAALGREFTPGLYITGQTDTVVLRVPEAVWPGLPGEILGGICAAGAFAAFMSASSGLLVAIAGTLSHDLWPQLAGASPPVGQRGRLRFRAAAVLGVVVPMAIALLAQGLDIGLLVGWAFALAASTFCPLFLLGIWWRGLTAPGVIAGIVSGGGVATTGIFLDLAHIGSSGTLGALLAQPAIVSVPIAFGVMIAVSLLTPGWLNDPDQQWLALHAPEELGLERTLLARRADPGPAG